MGKGAMDKQDRPERRKYHRIQKNFILTYYDMAYPQHRFEASQLKNISMGGMCLITSKGFPPHTVLAIEMKTPFLLELTHLEGLVLESHEKIKDIIYETRLEFKNLSPEAEYLLTKLVEHFEKKERG